MILEITETVNKVLEIEAVTTVLEIADFNTAVGKVPLSEYAAKGDILYGTGAGAVGALHSGSHNVGDVLTLEADGSDKVPSWQSMSDYVGGSWTAAGETWVYASATTITIAGDKREKYSIGTRIKLTQTTVKYFVIVKVEYASSTTTLTITGGSDYTLLNAAITSPYYSHFVQPVGYPEWFNYAPTYTGFSTAPSLTVSRFKVDGKTVTVHESENGFGTSNANTFQVTLPVTAANIANVYWMGTCGIVADNGTNKTGACQWVILPAAANVSVYSNMALGVFTASGNKRAVFTCSYDIE